MRVDVHEIIDRSPADVFRFVARVEKRKGRYSAEE
jgi:hypothetical protein